MHHNSLVSLREMLDFRAPPLLEVVAYLIGMRQAIATNLQVQAGMPFGLKETDFDQLVDTLKLFQDRCRAMNLPMSVIGAERFITLLAKLKAENLTEPGKFTKPDLRMVLLGNAEKQDVVTAIAVLTGRINDELETMKFLQLSASEAEIYSPSEPHFGHEVRSKFPTSIPEIDEASKCLALGRYTACVFHLMRALEIVLTAVGACLAIANPTNPNWGAWLKSIADEKTRRGPRWSERDLFQDFYQRLDAIKDAQRNSTMHVESIYTEEQAKAVFDATSSFMKKVASRMDENGLPLA